MDTGTGDSPPAALASTDAQLPENVRRLLLLAFGEDIGSSNLDTQGHLVESRKGEQLAEDGKADFNLLYGELLPESVSKALARLRAVGDGTILELGMGTGKVAFQAFLQSTSARRVVGVEISPARYDVSRKAAERLAKACPEKFSSWDASPSEINSVLQRSEVENADHRAVRGHVLLESASGRCLWLLEGDLAIVESANGPAANAQAVFLQLRLPPPARLRAYKVMQRVPDGCRLFSLENVAWEWTLPEPSILHAVDHQGTVIGETELFATSWCPEGYPFYLFYADRSLSPTITADYAVSYVQDLYAQSYF